MYEAAQRSVQEAQQQGAEVIIIAAHTGLPKILARPIAVSKMFGRLRKLTA